jgi:hypothetical protein
MRLATSTHAPRASNKCEALYWALPFIHRFCDFDDLSEAWITQGAGAVRGVEVFVELVGELAVVAGFGDVVPRRRIRGEEGLAGAKPVIEEFTRQRIGEAEGDEEVELCFCSPTFLTFRTPSGL